MPLRSAAVCCAVGLLMAATMTLLGCGEDTEVIAFLGGKVNATAATNYTTAAAENSTAVTEHNKSTEDVSRESKTAATEKTVKKTNEKLTDPQKACVGLRRCGSCSFNKDGSKDVWGQCVLSRPTDQGQGRTLYCATDQGRIDRVCACSASGVNICDSCRSPAGWGKCVFLLGGRELSCATDDQNWDSNDCTLIDNSDCTLLDNSDCFKFKHKVTDEIKSCKWIVEKGLQSPKTTQRRKNYCSREVATQCARACGDGCSGHPKCDSCSTRAGWGKCVPSLTGGPTLSCATDAQQWYNSDCTLLDNSDCTLLDNSDCFKFKHKVTSELKSCNWIAKTAQRRKNYCSGEVATQCAGACDFFAKVRAQGYW